MSLHCSTARAVALAFLLLPLMGCTHESAPTPMPADGLTAGTTDDPSAWPGEAEKLLEAGRPWRAARVMNAYRAAVGDLSPEHRLLAARAEAGWENWSAVPDLLADVEGLDSLQQGIGAYLLARAHDDAGEAERAAARYRAFLDAAPEARFAEERAAARLRLGLALVQLGEAEAGEALLADVENALGPAARWVDILRAEALARGGRVDAVRQATARYDRGIPGLRVRRALVEAARVAGDLGQARAVARSARDWASSDATKAEFTLLEGRLAIEQGEVDAGRQRLREAVALDASGAHGQAAAALLRQGAMTPADRLASARVYTGLGLHAEAAEDYRAWLAADAGTPAKRDEIRLALADVLIDGQQYAEAVEVLEPLGDDRAARDLRASALSRAGRTEQAAEIYRGLAAEQAGTEDGAAALYFAADAYQQGGDADAARPLYRDVVERHPGTGWMGLALMRLAGLAFLDGDFDEAAALWDRYRTRYPSGSLALQSTYWAARARAEAGDEAEADRLFREVRRRDRESYYALKASERLGEPFWPLPMSEAPPRDAAAEAQVARWMEPVDLLREAGFHDAAAVEAGNVVDRASGGRAVRYALAEALAERGYTRYAIGIGQRLDRSPRDARLLRILYPYPYREVIRSEAAERGFASTIAAALVRQESMFEARITSHVGARGLMQIMPATGAALAEAQGIGAWDRDFLYQPEINAHLGVGYIAEGLEAYDGSLPAVFAAYNAGPHQVEQWRTFPEFEADDELFTERIPFRETRDYVKKLTRNRAIYEGLYGGDERTASTENS